MLRRQRLGWVLSPLVVGSVQTRFSSHDGGDKSKKWTGDIFHQKHYDSSIQGPTGGDDRGMHRKKAEEIHATHLQSDRLKSNPIDESSIFMPEKPYDPNAKWEHDNPDQEIHGATGEDNKPGLYKDGTERKVGSVFFEQGKYAKAPKRPTEETDRDQGKRGREDNINSPEWQTAFGERETRPGGPHGGIPGMTKLNRVPPRESVDRYDIRPHHSAEDHHPFFDYTNKTGLREGFDTSNVPIHWDLKRAVFSLYRSCLQGLPLVKQYYWVNVPLELMAQRVRIKFEQNKYVNDRDAMRNLIMLGWTEYTEIITFRKQKGGVLKFFANSDDYTYIAKEYMKEEGKALEERKWWNGEEQKKEGPYDGFWSLAGKQNHEEFQKLKGRIPMGWSSSKNYFEIWRCDGTNFWEKNMDYEGWFLKNVDPDRAAARKEIQNWVSAGYQTPKHYASKNRRAYRRLVKDVDAIMNSSTHEVYAASRETIFQSYIRERCPETNRLYAEKKLARMDDDVFTTKFEFYDKCSRQVMREMPNPRLWKTDAFFLRLKYLCNPWSEYNWAKAPIGKSQEKLFNIWVSSDANYAVWSSPQFAELKECKKRNPMAKSWADFYTEFDPDVPETRKLPWYHDNFDYDKRYHWDERCMRMKRWVKSGDIDFKNNFFLSEVAKWEQMVNRPEIMREENFAEKKYTAPRMVQLYRSLQKRVEIALASQMVAALEAEVGAAKLQKLPAPDVTALCAKHNWTTFKFKCPVIIFPDNYEQPAAFKVDGTPDGAEPQKIEATA